MMYITSKYRCLVIVGAASSDPCAANFKGLKAFSEHETKAVHDYVTGIQGPLILAISIHCCLDKWLYPWGFDDRADIENGNEIVCFFSIYFLQS